MLPRSCRTWLTFVLALGLVFVVASPGLAAQADEKEAANLLTMIKESGPAGIGFLVVLGLFSLFMVSVAIERFFSMTRRTLMPDAFTAELAQLGADRTHEPSRFLSLVKQHDLSPMARILHAGLMRAGRPVVEVEKALEDGAARENAALRSRVRPLAVVGSVAPLVGLLGTVVGMIIAFRTASVAGDEKAELLAQGIYLALLTTAAGLSIAIPALLLVAYFNAKIDRYFREMDEQLMETIPCFAAMEQSSSPSTTAEPQRDFAQDPRAKDGELAAAPA
jgi:biopolymer transport protein ExbB